MARSMEDAILLHATQGVKFQKGVIKIWKDVSPLFQAFAGRQVSIDNGLIYKYNREYDLGEVAERTWGGDSTAYDATSVPKTSNLIVLTREIKTEILDVVQLDGDDTLFQLEAGLKAFIYRWNYLAIKGDSTSGQFAGLQELCEDETSIVINAEDGGALSLEKLDEAISMCNSPTHIVMNSTMINKFTKAMRDSSVAGNVYQTKDDFGNPLTFYGGLPIVNAGVDNRRQEIMKFNEIEGDGTACSSIYVCSFENDGVEGLVGRGGIRVADLGEMQTTPKYLRRVEMVTGLAMKTDRSAVRVKGITAADITA